MSEQGEHEPPTDGNQPTPQEITPVAGDSEDGAKAPLGDTVGTGTSIALGCVAGTIVLIAIGLIFLLLVVVFG